MKFSPFTRFNFFFVLSLFAFHCAFCFEQEIKNLASLLSQDIRKSGSHTIAVIDFTDLKGNVTGLGRFMAEEITASFAGTNKQFEVVDRLYLAALFEKNKIPFSGLIDPFTALKIKDISGAEAIVTGTITPFSDSIRVSAKILLTNTARIMDAVTVNIPRDKAINELLDRESQGKTGEENASSVKDETVSQIRDVSDFVFVLDRCILNEGNLTCMFNVTNEWGGDRNLVLVSARLFDEFGRSYVPANAVIGGIGAAANTYGEFGSDAAGYLQNVCPNNTMVKCSVTFNGVDPRMKKITLIELDCFSLQSQNSTGTRITTRFNNFKVQFNNIQRSKQ